MCVCLEGSEQMAPWGDSQSVNKTSAFCSQRGDFKSTFHMSRMPDDIKTPWCPSAFLHPTASCYFFPSPTSCIPPPQLPLLPEAVPQTTHLCPSSPLRQFNWTIQILMELRGQNGGKREILEEREGRAWIHQVSVLCQG